MRVKGPHHYKVTALGSCVKWPLVSKMILLSYPGDGKLNLYVPATRNEVAVEHGLNDMFLLVDTVG
jgi:hypothetical protein